MASTASDVQAQAAVDAWLNSQSVKDMQQAIDNAYQAGVNQANSSNQQIINQIEQDRNKYQNQYNKDVKQAYTNKELSLQTLSGELERLGLTDSGYGVSQKLISDSAYSKNVNDLKTQLADDMSDIDLQLKNQQLAYQAQLQELLKDKANSTYDYKKYLADMGEQIRQNEIANALQQRYYDYLYANMYSGGGGYGGGGSGSSSGISLDNSSGGGSELSSNEATLTNVKKSTPVFRSQKANKWYMDNIHSLEKQGKLTESALESALDKGLASGVINKSDLNKILNTFGM